MLELLQAVLDEYAVFVPQWNHIGYGPDTYEIEIFFEVRLIGFTQDPCLSKMGPQGHNEVKCDADAG